MDVTLTPADGMTRRLSLKSTAARNLSERTAHISKLTEAAWIQDVRSARARRRHTLKLFREYRAAVDAIVMLRAFREPDTIPHRYQLIEIPSGLFKSLENAPESAFAADGPVVPPWIRPSGPASVPKVIGTPASDSRARVACAISSARPYASAAPDALARACRWGRSTS